MKGAGTGANRIMGPGRILTIKKSPEPSLTCRLTITGCRPDTGRYPMDSSKRTGENGNGNDIGKGMTDGGKADTGGLEIETILDLITDAVALLKEEIAEATVLVADNARTIGHRIQTARYVRKDAGRKA
jgi:hypothetical protein